MPGPARPFAPGQSGNPSGRPVKTPEMRAAEALMRSKSEKGAADLIAMSETCADEAVRARLLCFRYEAVFGKATQAITGGDGEPLIPPPDLSRLTDAELATIVGVARSIASGAGDGDGGAGGDSSEGSGQGPP